MCMYSGTDRRAGGWAGRWASVRVHDRVQRLAHRQAQRHRCIRDAYMDRCMDGQTDRCLQVGKHHAHMTAGMHKCVCTNVRMHTPG